ncbi:hypothetical protein ACFO0N_12430 [Halobium salinum]|uniref:Uncharacterized protein n=1 Tax=Halobium salinum TaxID=1364940 RepID=A0ABD5PCY5_9EURY|nr:hypothetical protein [Halobium salinum]
MRLAEDRRARVPFALVGVLLLVGSATFAASLAQPPVREDRSVGVAMDRAEASATTELRSAVREAARDAARRPVTAAANTTAGRALNESTPFRDALRLRIYLAAREAFASSSVDRRGVVASATLSGVEETTASVRTAKRRVGVESVGGGSAVRVVLRNVTIRAERRDRVVASERETLTATVATPVLAAHDRTVEYERRLNAAPLAGPGLGNHLSARLYPIAWARGGAQFGGAPIENVVSNRHVEFATNGGLLATQRNVYGRTDRGARYGYRVAAGTVALHDLFAGEVVTEGNRADEFVPPPALEPPRQGTPPTLTAERNGGTDSGPNRTFTVSVNRTADLAYLSLLDGEPTRGVARSDDLDAALGGAYRAEAVLLTRVRQTRNEDRPPATAPGANWSLVRESVSTRTVVRDTAVDERWRPTTAGVEGSRGGGSDQTFTRFARYVVERHTVTRTWRRGSETVRRESTWADRHRVDAALRGRYRPTAGAPNRSTRPLFRRGGAVDGPNLADVRGAARSRLVDGNGGRDGVARRAVEGSLDSGSRLGVGLGGGGTETVVRGDRPRTLRPWVAADLADLRERVRAVGVEVSSGAVAAGDANPPAALASRLRSRRASLVDAPETYDGAADRARVAARAAYLDRVLAALDRQAADQSTANGRLGDLLAERGPGPGDVRRLVAGRYDEGSTPESVVDADAPGGSVTLVPDGSPGYLTLSPTTGRHVAGLPEGASYRPLAARNVNLFTVPYGDAADAVLEPLLAEEKRVSLRTGAATLVAANRTLEREGGSNLTLQRRRTRLRKAVSRGIRPVDTAARATLARRTDLSKRERVAVVTAAGREWNGVGRRALAATNGSFARAVAAEARTRADLSAREANTLSVRLRVRIGSVTERSAASVPQAPTNRTAVATQAVSHALVEHAVSGAAGNLSERAVERLAGGTYGSVPAGLPVLPPGVGPTYGVVNAWTVDVRGEYRRFAVRARSGPPSDGAGLTYVRDGASVRLDVDGDGDGERLGANERVSFRTGTVVVVAVPPWGTGVGDVDGVMNESSEGWPRPGCESEPAQACETGGV